MSKNIFYEEELYQSYFDFNPRVKSYFSIYILKSNF